MWLYWEDLPGSSRSPYLDLCIETVHRNAGTASVRMLDQNSALEWLPATSSELLSRLPSPVHRSDYVRTHVIHRYGGLWLDVDTIALRPLTEVTALLRDVDVVGWGRELEGRFYSNFFAARPGAPLIGEWIGAQDEVLRTTDPSRMRYAALGQIVGRFADRHEYLNLPIERVAPIPWHSARQFISRLPAPQRLLAAEPYVVVLWNKAMGTWLQDRSREELLNGSTLLSCLLRIGLHLSTPDEETRGLARLDALSRLRFSTAGRAVELKVRRRIKRTRRFLGLGPPRQYPNRTPL